MPISKIKNSIISCFLIISFACVDNENKKNIKLYANNISETCISETSSFYKEVEIEETEDQVLVTDGHQNCLVDEEKNLVIYTPYHEQVIKILNLKYCPYEEKYFKCHKTIELNLLSEKNIQELPLLLYHG